LLVTLGANRGAIAVEVQFDVSDPPGFVIDLEPLVELTPAALRGRRQTSRTRSGAASDDGSVGSRNSAMAICGDHLPTARAEYPRALGV